MNSLNEITSHRRLNENKSEDRTSRLEMGQSLCAEKFDTFNSPTVEAGKTAAVFVGIKLDTMARILSENQSVGTVSLRQRNRMNQESSRGILLFEFKTEIDPLGKNERSYLIND